MIKEIKKFKDCGGSSIVEATTNGIYPDWEFLKEISEATGVHIIAGAGYYLDSGLTDDVKSASIEDLTKVSTFFLGDTLVFYQSLNSGEMK